jgi:hypothetical protein
MATITVPTFTVANVNATTVALTVNYTLTPNATEKLAGTVFSENIQAIGDDPGIISDIVVTNFPVQVFAVNAATVSVARSRTRNVLKANMNEDPAFLANGAEQSDEVLARVTLSYAANPPIPPAIPPVTNSAAVSGAWK